MADGHPQIAHVLLETDGPFARSGNRSAVPSDLLGTLNDLARLWAIPTSDVRKAMVQNQQRLGTYDEPSA
jgi:TatD DNase family protein